MAKAKVQPSKRSRAARRATSPGIDTDKSLKDVPLPKTTTNRPSVLAVHQSAGVQKKSKPTRKSRMSSKMRRRHEKGLEMAEAVTERTGRKIAASIDHAKTMQARRKKWEEINQLADEEGAAVDDSGSRFAALMGEENDEEWEDEVDNEDGFDPSNPRPSKPDDDDDEIL